VTHLTIGIIERYIIIVVITIIIISEEIQMNFSVLMQLQKWVYLIKIIEIFTAWSKIPSEKLTGS
jgi:hypothetical protein